MQKIIKNVFTIFFLQLFWSLCLLANGYLVLDTGHRYDRIDEMLEFDEKVFSRVVRPFLNSAVRPAGTDEQSFQNIQSYQLGVRGFYASPCIPIIVKGSTHYNWVFDGGYNENYLVKSDIKGHIFDVSGAIGYLFCIGDYFSIAPLIGGSFDRHDLRLFDSHSVFDGAPEVNGLRWASSFYGPWVGFDIYLGNCCFCPPISLNLGYEFHYGWAHIDLRPRFPRADQLFYHYTVNHKHMMGNVFHLQALYTFCDNWIIGIYLQYTCWSNSHKTKANIPPQEESGLAPNVFQRDTVFTWRSITTTLNLGLCF